MPANASAPPATAPPLHARGALIGAIIGGAVPVFFLWDFFFNPIERHEIPWWAFWVHQGQTWSDASLLDSAWKPDARLMIVAALAGAAIGALAGWIAAAYRTARVTCKEQRR